MIKDQGHSAFPVYDDGTLFPGYGLSKKELFAAMAMQGILSGANDLNCTTIVNYSIIMADELCKQLDIKND